jgi:AraC-like DNA-binding protein
VQASGGHQTRIAPSASIASAVTALFVDACERDTPRVAIPRAESQLVVRFGPFARRGLDVHAFGARQRAHRKLIRGGQRSVTARLCLGADQAVLGVPAAALAGRIVALEDLWGETATRRLTDRLASTRDSVQAAAVLDGAIAARLASDQHEASRAQLAMEAASRLASASVNAVASDLGVSERHLRRMFRETVGLGPKAFARLTRFHRALRAARGGDQPNWASIAAEAGYYDQAHLIAEFRQFAGATPQALLDELRLAATAPSSAPGSTSIESPSSWVRNPARSA